MHVWCMYCYCTDLHTQFTEQCMYVRVVSTDLHTQFTEPCMYVRVVKGITIAHTVLCALQYKPCPFRGFLQASLRGS